MYLKTTSRMYSSLVSRREKVRRIPPAYPRFRTLHYRLFYCYSIIILLLLLFLYYVIACIDSFSVRIHITHDHNCIELGNSTEYAHTYNECTV